MYKAIAYFHIFLGKQDLCKNASTVPDRDPETSSLSGLQRINLKKCDRPGQLRWGIWHRVEFPCSCVNSPVMRSRRFGSKASNWKLRLFIGERGFYAVFCGAIALSFSNSNRIIYLTKPLRTYAFPLYIPLPSSKNLQIEFCWNILKWQLGKI